MKESLKLKLLRVAANNASCTAEVKSLLDFITKYEKPAESKHVEVKTSLEDGVYVVFSSGEIKPVSEYNEQCEPAKVLMIYRDHGWIVASHDAECGKTTLLTMDAERDSDSPFYKAEIEALSDFNMESCTAHLRKAGLAFELDDDMFIPTAGQLAAMWLYRDSLNKALKATGCEPLKTDKCYWSSSEGSAYGRWYLHFSYGTLYNSGNEYNSYYVRPCTAFKL